MKPGPVPTQIACHYPRWMTKRMGEHKKWQRAETDELVELFLAYARAHLKKLPVVVLKDRRFNASHAGHKRSNVSLPGKVETR